MKITIPNIDKLNKHTCTIAFYNMHIVYHTIYKYIQYHVLLRHVPTWLLHLHLLIAVKQDWLLNI